MRNAAISRTSGSTALEKGLALFSRIIADRGRTPLGTLAAGMNLPRSTLHRLTASLEAQGLVTRVSRGHYDIGLGLAVSVETVTAVAQLARLCRPALRALAVKSNATAHLGVMENDMVTYVVKETGKGPNGAIPFTCENAQLEAYCSGIGKVLLAWLPAGARARYLEGGPFVALTDRTMTDPETLARHLEIVRARQFACDDGEVAENLRCLAVPLWTEPSPIMAAISLSFLKSHGSPDEDAVHLAALRACAARIRDRVGHFGRDAA